MSSLDPPTRPGPALAIDTSTSHSIVALEAAGGTSERDVTDVGRRHGPALFEQLDRILAARRLRPSELGLIIAGTGPGSFTGLRVGLAAAKTLAYVTGIPVVGVGSSDALRRAAVDAGVAGPEAALVLPAGAHDHYLAEPGESPRLVAPGMLVTALQGREAIAVGLGADLIGEDAVRRGAAALAGLPEALIALGRAAGRTDAGDPATLVPAYVALPRGITAEEMAWSPDLRSA